MSVSLTDIVQHPEEFQSHFKAMVSAVLGMLAATAGSGTPEELEDECGFQLAARRQRPAEFLQVLLDMSRVIFEPNPHGTFHLNSNWDFIYEGVPSGAFRLGYVSVQGQPGQSVAEVAEGLLNERMAALNYDFHAAHANFVAAWVGSELYRLSTSSELVRIFKAGISVERAFGAIRDVAGGAERVSPAGQTSAGLALDGSLAPAQVRLSCWLFLPPLTAQ